MKQIEITAAVPLLNEKGALIHPGYSTHLYHEYDPAKTKSFPLRLKEWDFYQFQLDDWVVQLTIGHVSYATQIDATLFSVANSTRYNFSRLYPLKDKSIHWTNNPEVANTLEVHKKDFDFVFETGEDYKHFTLKTKGKGETVDIDLFVPWNKSDEKMVIATPFEKAHQFYFNYKEHFYGVKGHVRFGKQEVLADGKQTCMLDWGRGVWPYSHEWFWGCGSDYKCGGRFGFNIGWGFGNLENATENMFFWNGKAYKLGELKVDRDASNYMAPWHFYTEEGNFDFTMTPIYDNYTEMNVVVINKHCHQVFGKYNGTAKLPDGTILEIKDLLAFCEHAENNW